MEENPNFSDIRPDVCYRNIERCRERFSPLSFLPLDVSTNNYERCHVAVDLYCGLLPTAVCGRVVGLMRALPLVRRVIVSRDGTLIHQIMLCNEIKCEKVTFGIRSS